jgi:hypothetical protein
MVVYSWNPSVRRLRQEDLKFETTLGYTVSPTAPHPGW